jgi:hypothetical protein
VKLVQTVANMVQRELEVQSASAPKVEALKSHSSQAVEETGLGGIEKSTTCLRLKPSLREHDPCGQKKVVAPCCSLLQNRI